MLNAPAVLNRGDVVIWKEFPAVITGPTQRYGVLYYWIEDEGGNVAMVPHWEVAVAKNRPGYVCFRGRR
jgi:hypothetical protein